MARYAQPMGTRGSQKWIQKLINEKPDILSTQIRKSINLPAQDSIEWLSPLKADDYAEYRDEAFLIRLGIEPGQVPLESFWPKRGPQWDALGKSSSGRLFLVEAKSHIPELLSTLGAKDAQSKKKIQSSLETIKRAYGSRSSFDWSITFYQYSNRLAHVRFLRDHEKPAFLVFVYFLNDSEVNGPSTALEWQGATKLLHSCLGVSDRTLKKYVINAFIDVDLLH